MSRASLAAAFAELQDGSGRVAQARLRDLLTRAGWGHSSFSAMRALVPIKGATHNDVIYLLRSLGFTDRAIGDGKLAVTLAQVTPFFLSQCAGQRAPPNPLLVRAVIGGACLLHRRALFPRSLPCITLSRASFSFHPTFSRTHTLSLPPPLPPSPARSRRAGLSLAARGAHCAGARQRRRDCAARGAAHAAQLCA